VLYFYSLWLYKTAHSVLWVNSDVGGTIQSLSLLLQVMQFFYLGGSLDKHKNIPEHILGPISVSIVRGLQYLWSLKIMHRGLCAFLCCGIIIFSALSIVWFVVDTTCEFCECTICLSFKTFQFHTKHWFYHILNVFLVHCYLCFMHFFQ